MDLILLIGLIWACRHAVKDTTAAVRRHRDQRMAEIKKANPVIAGDPRKQAVQQMRLESGWWLSEALHGFPVARHGWHAGWIAHQTAVLHQRKVRDEARDTHEQTRESLRQAYEERRKQAQNAIDQHSTTWSTPPKGKAWREAAKEAALAPVVPIRPDQPTQAPAPGRGPYARRDSDWLEPWQARCRTCGGTGGVADGTCPACRGWGSAPPSLDVTPAPAGTTCSACGRPGTADDPVLPDGPGFIHRSEAERMHADVDGMPLRATVTSSDYYDTRPRTSPRVTPDNPDAVTWGVSSEDAREASKDGQLRTVVQKMPDGTLKPLAQFRDGKPVNEFREGTPVPTGTTAETTYGQSLTAADQMITESEAEIARLQLSRVPAMIEDLSNSGVGGGAMSALDGAQAAISAQIAAARQQLDHWQSFKSALVRDHGAGAEYHQSAPDGGAERAFLRE